ncbi:hypothetical protein C8F04DRAFT_1156619 [Mycena alexandri]|uniref:F-box domain-containing protein n=1 Tax=Mycena alexandri TaxID=1745969 RepID=A0AAD6WLV2_9AGAR|nr:hypothetical protein C8F04DRAFT_1156619 [Mycena alexandri]
MLRLPVELWEIIFSFVDDEKGIRALFQVSRFLRQLVMPHLLLRHNITIAEVLSGIIHLSCGAEFLVPTLSSINPIQELTIPAERRSLERLLSILREHPRIPQLLILGGIPTESKPSIAALIAMHTRNNNPIVIVGHGGAFSRELPGRVKIYSAQ